MREILEHVFRAVHRNVTSGKPMSVKDCYRAFRLVERTLSLERTFVAEALAEESGSAEARGRRDLVSQALVAGMTRAVAAPARAGR